MPAAYWEFVDHTRQGLLWYPVMPVEEATLSLDLELARSWRRLDSRLDVAQEFILPGQLLMYRLIQREEEPLVEMHARVGDLGQTMIAPVALAFPPEDLSNVPEEATRFRAASFLPPATFGQCGVAFEQRQRWMYPLVSLDPTAVDLQANLAALLRQVSEPDFEKESTRWRQAQAIAHQLASRYYAFHLNMPSVARTSVTTPRELATQATSIIAMPRQRFSEALPSGAKLTPSPQGTFLVPAGQPVQAVLQAIYAQANQWHEQAGIPTFVVSKRAERTIIQIRPEEAVSLDEQVTQFLWQIVQALSDLDAVLFLALLGIHLASSPDEQGGHWVYINDLLELRGIAGYHPDNRERIADAMERINMAWLQILRRGEVDAPITKLVLIDSLLLKRRTLGITTYHQMHPHAVSIREGRPYAYHMRMGSWLDQRFPLVRLHQRILQYRLQSEFWEERLLAFFSMQGQRSHRRIYRCQIRTLFDVLTLPRDTRHPQLTRDRFEEALKELRKQGQIGEWKLVPSQDKMSSKGWFDQWLDWYLEVVLHATQPEALSSQSQTVDA